MNNIMFSILLLKVIHFRFLDKIGNIETGFIDGDVKEQIFMECLYGMKGAREMTASFYMNASVAWS